MPSERDVLLQLAIGLEYIYSQKVIHRDVKPANVLISMNGVIKWADFGLSKIVEKSSSRSFTYSGLRGSPRWLAPEHIDRISNKNLKIKGGAKSDVFALGCLFFFFLVPAVHPFGNDAETQETIHERIKEGKPVNFGSMNLIQRIKYIYWYQS